MARRAGRNAFQARQYLHGLGDAFLRNKSSKEAENSILGVTR